MSLVICNPLAGNGRARRVCAQVEALLVKRGMVYQVRYTEAPGHATLLAAQAVRDGESDVISVGGDGTAYEISLGLQGSKTALIVIPAGTGNDVIKTVGIPKDPVKALEYALAREPKPTDMGRLNERSFLNVCGTGFDVCVLEHALKAKKHVRGLLPYLYGVVRAIFSFKPITIEYAIDGGAPATESLLICAVANGRWIGGGIPIAPKASMDDGLLDVVLIRSMKKPRMLFYCLPRLLAGKVLDFPETKHLRCKEIKFKSPGMLLNVDGEIIPMNSAVCKIAPNAVLMRR